MGRQVVLRCHCGQFNINTQLRDEIPVGGFLCHCNSCRYVTGALMFSGIPLVDPPIEAISTKLCKYATSEKIDRYFCGTCGSHVCYHMTKVKDTPWRACSGCIDEVAGGNSGCLEKHDGHWYLADTLDGGLALTLPHLPMYVEESDTQPVADITTETARWEGSKSHASVQKRGNAQCHCGQVNFDMLLSENGEKWEAEICACRSCRLSFGQPITAWALSLPYDRIIWKDGTVHDGSAHESIRRFHSSDLAHREFCPKCGATIFYYSLVKRPGKVDVGLGIIRAEDGALARSLVKWNTKSIAYIEDAFDKDLFAAVQQNLEALGRND